MRRALVDRAIEIRARRRNFLPQWLFDGEAPWELLLGLYYAKLSGKTVNLDSLTTAATVPSSVAWRWVQALRSANLVVITNHMLGGSEIIAISDEGYRRLESYFDTLDASSLSV